MDPGQLFWIWLIAGGVLMGSELLVPGLITIFLGLAAVVVAFLYKLELLENVVPGVTWWFILSLFLVFFMREMVIKMLPGDAEVKEINEDLEAYGSIVEVIDDVHMEHNEGRIKFRGTTWQATTSGPVIPKGETAKIVARDNLVWIVEAVKKIV